MRKIILATALTLMCGSAFAQGTTGPAAQGDNMTKPGMTNSEKGSMNNNTTTGSSMSKEGMSKDGMSNGMNKNTGGESKDGQGMNKGGAMSK